jgi:hypothetical protein
MAFRKQKVQPEPVRTLGIAERLEGVEGRTSNALGLFRQAAVSLDAAADEANVLASEADEKATYYEGLRVQAQSQASASRAQAVKIKEFIGE